MDSTSYSAYAASSVCHVALIAWCLWSVGLHQLELQSAPEQTTAKVASSQVPEFAVLISQLPESQAEELGQMTLPPLPELATEELSSEFITPRLFQSSGNDTNDHEQPDSGEKTAKEPSIALPHSSYQATGGLFSSNEKAQTDIDPEIKSISEYWHTINAIILSSQYQTIWKKRFHKKMPRHSMLLSIRIRNSSLVAATLKRGTGNNDFDTLFMTWLLACIQRQELNGPPVTDGQYPVEFLIR